MVRELFVAFAVLIAAPFCMGLLPARALPGEKWKSVTGPVTVYVAGFMLELAVFQLVAVPIILTSTWGFPLLVGVFSVCLLLLSVAGLYFGRGILKGMQRDARETLSDWAVLFGNRRKKHDISEDGACGQAEKAGVLDRLRAGSAADQGGLAAFVETGLYWILALGLIVFQLVMAYLYASFDGDDAYYVVQSVIADETDVLYRILPYTGLSTNLDVRHALAAFPMWIAYLARTTGIHAAIVAHSIVPLILIPVTYMLYYRIGVRLFGGRGRKTATFMIVVSLLQIFGNTSIYTNATFFLMRTWQGKSLLCNFVLLSLFWSLLQLPVRDTADEGTPAGKQDGGRRAGWWLLLLSVNIIAALGTTMGAFLTALVIAVAGLVFAVHRRKPGILVPMAACCIPSVVYLLLYVVLAY